MSNGFFDFSTDLPTLGSGKAKEFSEELLGGPDDDEIDQLNDETFGDAAIEGDWEEQHEKLAGEIGSCRRHEFASDDFLSGGHKYTSAQDELEHSLNQLVVDDDDSEPYSQLNGKPIPRKHQVAADVDSLFGPSSPPGLLNTEELVGGQQNIWGSPVRESYVPKQEDGLKNLLKVLQKPKAAPVPPPQHQDPSIVTSGKSLSSALHNARTLTEIERDLGPKQPQRHAESMAIPPPSQGGPNPTQWPRPGEPISIPPPRPGEPISIPPPRPGEPISIPPPRPGEPISIPPPRPDPVASGFPGQAPGHKPVVRTLEEIEQEMTGRVQSAVRKVPSPPAPGMPFPIGTPPQTTGLRPKSGPVPIPGGFVNFGRGAPPPMPSPGHPTPGTASHKVVSGSAPPLGQVSILQRTSPPPNAGHKRPGVIRGPPPLHAGPDKRTSPLSHDHHQRVLRSPSPTALLAFSLPTSPSPFSLARLNPASPDNLKTTITQGIISGMLGNHGDVAGSPGNPRSVRPHRMPGDRPTSPLDGTFFMPNTPSPRMPVPGHGEPHNRGGHRGGPPGHPPIKPGMYRSMMPDHHQGSPDDHHFRYPEPHRGRGDFGFHGRGEFNHHGRGDFPYRGRGDFGHRGDYGPHRGGRGDFPHHRDFPGPHRGPPRDDFGPRGEFGHNGRGDFHPHHRGYPPHRHGPGFRGHPPPGYHGDRFEHRPRYNSYGEDEVEEDRDGNRDEFAGLMTRKEKDWVIKIQLMQLQTENPYLDDYYYTSWAMKRLKKERQEALDENKGDDNKAEPKLVIPHLARVETKGYKPVQFENSLGRVTASSVHNPRQIIDIKRSSSLDHEDAKAREVRRFKELLLDVEKGYDLLLDVDDIEKKALGLPQESRPPLFEQRHDRITHLYNMLLARTRGEGGLCELLVIRKGIKLVCRTLPLLPKIESQLIVRFFLHDLTAISKKDWQKDVLPSVYKFLKPVILSADLEALVEFTVALTGVGASQENINNMILSAMQNKFGSSILWLLLSRGESIYVKESPVDLDLAHQQAWTEFVKTVASSLAKLTKDNLVDPLQKFPSVAAHLQRLVDKRLFLSVEDTLHGLMGAPAK